MHKPLESPVLLPRRAPLADKLAASVEFLSGLARDHDLSRVAVAWTGGKDSTTVLWLWKQVLAQHGGAPLRAISIDTGLKFPEVMAFRDRMAKQWGVDVYVARPNVRLDTYPVAKDKVACCAELKIAPLKSALRELRVEVLLTGVRADEHPSRSGRLPMEPRTDPDILEANPILHWAEMDVWAHTTQVGLPYCGLYDLGYRSLGCRPCTAPAPGGGHGDGGERAGRHRDKEGRLEALRDLGYF